MQVAPEILRSTAHAAVGARIESGMTVGLGSGSTASLATERIEDLLSSGELEDVRGIPTSETTARLAREVGIPLLALPKVGPDVTIDGADEIQEGNLSLIKGHGGALLREKIVASRGYLVVVADTSKLVDQLGKGSLPVEVEPFGWQSTVAALSAFDCEPTLRTTPDNPESPFVTDGGHFTVDCTFGPIPDPASLEPEVKCIPGALECGIFVDLARVAYAANEEGTDIMEA
jgi:ribose 5-phosphate isomerase A